MPLDCKLVNRTSKDGNPYQCIEIYLTESYKKTVFLDNAEKELILLSHRSTK